MGIATDDGTTGSTPVRHAALDALRSAGLRATPARRALLDVLADTAEHLDAEALVGQVATRAPGAHRATVYRALHTLTECGLVSHTHLPGEATVYHLGGATGATPHAHLQCHRCGRVLDVPVSAFADLTTALERDHGFRLEPDHGALLGLCPDCRDT